MLSVGFCTVPEARVGLQHTSMKPDLVLISHKQDDQLRAWDQMAETEVYVFVKNTFPRGRTGGSRCRCAQHIRVATWSLRICRSCGRKARVAVLGTSQLCATETVCDAVSTSILRGPAFKCGRGCFRSAWPGRDAGCG